MREKLMDEYMKYIKKIADFLDKEPVLKGILILLGGSFVMFYLVAFFVNPVLAGFMSGYAIGFSSGFYMVWKYGRKFKVFVQGKKIL